MLEFFNDPAFGGRNRIVALVLAALVLLGIVAAWLLLDGLVALLTAFATAAAILGLWAYRSQGNTWPAAKLDGERREGRDQ